MKIILLLCFSISSLHIFAQDKLTVKYSEQYLLSTGKADKDGNTIFKWTSFSNKYKLTVADNISAFRNLVPSRIYSSSLRDGDVINYADTKTGHIYIPVPPVTEKELMVVDSISTFNWKFTGQVDTICGFSCREAIAVQGDGYIYAWYAYELPKSFGPFDYTGLPGTVLAVEFSQSNLRYMAVDVNEETDNISIPDVAVITPENYDVLSKEKRKYRAGLFGKRVDPNEVPRRGVYNTAASQNGLLPEAINVKDIIYNSFDHTNYIRY